MRSEGAVPGKKGRGVAWGARRKAPGRAGGVGRWGLE